MTLWRISRHKDLSGLGGFKASGRWHSPGQPVVYLAESPAAALLEVCVHTAANDVPPDFTLLRVEGPEVKADSVAAKELKEGWTLDLETTQKIGTAWLRAGKAVLLKIPSAIVPQTTNYLFNPLHPDAKKFRIAETLEYPFDVRIKR
jgi:RES domain-containing protein